MAISLNRFQSNVQDMEFKLMSKPTPIFTIMRSMDVERAVEPEWSVAMSVRIIVIPLTETRIVHLDMK